DQLDRLRWKGLGEGARSESKGEGEGGEGFHLCRIARCKESIVMRTCSRPLHLPSQARAIGRATRRASPRGALCGDPLASHGVLFPPRSFSTNKPPRCATGAP